MSGQGDRVADRYELVAPLGEGGMGVVWRARDARLGREVAVKVLSAETVGSATARARLIREARAAAALEHEGIIRVYDVGETEDGGAFLVMELIRGRSFRAALADGSLSLGRRAQIIVTAARALGFANAAGIIHRDVKPDNIMIREDGAVKVVDFGIAKPLATETPAGGETVPGVTANSLTGAGQLVGTPAYLAPEQARGLAVTSAVDQFALAVTAFEALTGQLPWHGTSTVEIIAAVLRDDAGPMSKRASVPVALDDVIARALAKEPGERWPSMEAFADAMAEAASSLALDAPAPPPLGSDKRVDTSSSAKSAAVSAPDRLTTAASADSHGPRSTLMTRLGVAFVGVAIIGGGAWFASRSGAPSGPGASSSASASAGASAASSSTAGALACPAFEVKGLDEPWLGTAGAALACERFQLAHGGVDARTLVPAELADIPREISHCTVRMPDDAPARQAAVEVAKKRGSRWLDGTIEKVSHGFAVRLVMRLPDGTELRRGEGRGVELFEAVAEATKPLLQAEGPPTPAELASLEQWLDVKSVDAALALVDVRTAILIEDPVSLKAACGIVAQHPDAPARVKYFTKVACARRLRTGKVEEPPPAIDESTPGALITTAMAHGSAGGKEAVRERAALLEKAREKATVPEGQARLSAAAAELYHLIGDEKSRVLARGAVQASPKAVDWRMSAWHRLAFASDGDVSLANALAAWHPWQPVSHSLRATRGVLSDANVVEEYMVRTYLLGQRGYYANQYGEHLVKRGKIEAARGVAEVAGDPLLEFDIMNGEARYGAVLVEAPRRLRDLPADDENAATAFRLASKAVRAALTLGKPTDFVDIVVTKYVDAEPHHIIDGVVPFVSLVSSCSFAPSAIGKRCIARLKKLHADGKLAAIFKGVDVVLEGAQHYVDGDYAGATKVLRTLLRAPAWVREPLFVDLMASTFDRTEAYDLAEEVDAAVIALVDLPRTADLGWARGAKRAQRKGDTARARKLAQAVLDKWRFADEDPLAMRDMRELLVKLPP